MEARAVARYIRISPTKVRRVVDLIRGKDVEAAMAILTHVPNRAAQVVRKVVHSAVSNAVNNYSMSRDELVIAEAYVDRGPSMKRVIPRARGRADILTKRSSHITIVVRERE
jgi:large subunit ribosomal protein L22